ncbi:hypothetical protein NOCA1190110 [metagenome]|uniref:Uncharacterized protein n=1 Tax=metagenome TaxID=256318 RepID=A0A2P2CCV1_9ZZZZ
MPSFAGGTAWLGSLPLTPAELGGHVVLVQFWTFTCINWIRTAPSLLARISGTVRERLIEVDFARAGVEAYAFTFG